nr:inositol 3-kinase-like [Ipomoea batatas]
MTEAQLRVGDELEGGLHGILEGQNLKLQIAPFPKTQVDPIGAGDSFVGGYVAGLVHGLYVTEAALLGNLFGSLTVGQIEFSKSTPWQLRYSYLIMPWKEGSYATIYQLWDGGDVKQVWRRNRNSALLLGFAWKLGPLSGVVKVEDD